MRRFATWVSSVVVAVGFLTTVTYLAVWFLIELGEQALSRTVAEQSPVALWIAVPVGVVAGAFFATVTGRGDATGAPARVGLPSVVPEVGNRSAACIPAQRGAESARLRG